MPAPASVIYSTDAKVASMTAVLAELDGGTSAASIQLFTEADVLLAAVPLNDPAGTVDGSGILTLDITGPDLSANNSGECTYATLANDLGTVVTIPVKQGFAAELGYLVMGDTNIIIGTEVTITSVTLGT